MEGPNAALLKLRKRKVPRNLKGATSSGSRHRRGRHKAEGGLSYPFKGTEEERRGGRRSRPVGFFCQLNWPHTKRGLPRGPTGTDSPRWPLTLKT